LKFGFFYLPRMSPTAKVWLVAQTVYAVAPLGGTTHPMASPTTWVVCAAELCSKAATAATKRKTMLNLLAIALLCCRSGRPCLCYSVFALFLELQLGVIVRRENSIGGTSRSLYFIEGGHLLGLKSWEPCAARWMPRN
jgi:hypothetical protein